MSTSFLIVRFFFKSIFDWNWKNQGNEPGSEGGALKMVLLPYSDNLFTECDRLSVSEFQAQLHYTA